MQCIFSLGTTNFTSIIIGLHLKITQYEIKMLHNISNSLNLEHCCNFDIHFLVNLWSSTFLANLSPHLVIITN